MLGPELITNGTFNSDATGWAEQSASGGVSSGVLTATAAGTPSGLYQAFSTEIGISYRVQVEMRRGNLTTEVRCRITNGATPGAGYAEVASTATESLEYKTFDFTAIGTTSNVYLRITDGGTGATGLFDNVSVREILPDGGIHNTNLIGPMWGF